LQPKSTFWALFQSNWPQDFGSLRPKPKLSFLGIISKQLAAILLWLAAKDKIAHFGHFLASK